MIALYVRVSTKEQLDGYSIDEQTERLKAYCKAKGFKKYKEYTDGGFSGGSLDRPALTQLLKDVKSGKVKTVMVYKLDRLSRSQKDTLYIIEDVLLKNDCGFVSLTENFDTNTPFGKAMIGILSVFAQLEREQIKERMSLGMEGRAKGGKYHGGGYAPFGYTYKDGQLKINQYEAKQVRECYKLFLEGLTFAQISRKFYDKGYKRTNQYWTPVSIKRCLTNEIYIGKVKYNGEIYDGQHKPIIKLDTFNMVKDKLERTPVSARPYSRTLLGGILYCKKCGCRYTTQNSNGYRYYICDSKRKRNTFSRDNFKCENKRWREEELSDLIIKEIKKINLGKINQKSNPVDTKLIKKEISNLEGKIKKLIDLFLVDGIDKVELQNRLNEYNKQKDKLTKELNKPISAIKKIKSWDDVFERATIEQQRAIVQSLIERIDLDGEKVYIKWFSE